MEERENGRESGGLENEREETEKREREREILEPGKERASACAHLRANTHARW